MTNPQPHLAPKGLPMLKPLALLALLLPGLVFGQANWRGPGPATGATVAPLALSVTTAGNDANACTASAPCLTVQGALNKVPRMVRHPVEITVGTGTFAGASIEGFTFDRSNSATASAWIHISGTMITATATTGSASGTATSGTTGTWSDGTVNTVTVSGAGWTSDDFKGKLLWFTSGSLSGLLFPIATNSATVISFTNLIGSSPSAGNTFTVLDWGTTISNSVPRWATPSGVFSSGFTANTYGMVVQAAGATENVGLNKLRFTTTVSGSFGALINGSTVSFTYNKFDGTTGGPRILISNGSKALTLANVFSLSSSSRAMYVDDESQNSGVFSNWWDFMPGAAFGQGNAYIGQSAGSGRGFQLDSGFVISQYEYFNSLDRCVNAGRSEVQVNHDVMLNSSLGVNFSTGDDLPASGEALIDSSWMANMSNGAIAMNGAGRLSVKTVGGTGNAVGLRCWTNCLMVVTSATTITGTVEISLDSANFSLATLRAASPRTLLDNWYGSRITQSN